MLGTDRRQALVGVNPAPGVADALRRRWRFPDAGGSFDHWHGYGASPLTVVDGTVFASGSWRHPTDTQRAGVVALSAANGDPAWTYPVVDDLPRDDPSTGDPPRDEPSGGDSSTGGDGDTAGGP